ncbi:amidohydrolase family protein [Streptomyces sp. S.PNR 29]|uniref:amidohydrolase family protein n=1 Tax=Streptomyces sp. S.PNR 29 TaxID=2973805 RepID=UPI0025AFFE92|nr:amidohydrolase family protein [Streptomyces sp. S.PNR 29]MDN0198867.1 amidohydrolase family protein [Streptomyces sp. S.PNR 29]
MTRIDAHHHTWRPMSASRAVADIGPRRRAHPWLDKPDMAPLRRDFTLVDLAQEAAAVGIDRTILVQVLPETDETAEFLTLAERTDLVAGVVGWADLTSNRLSDTLSALRAAPGGELLVGLRHLVQSEPDPDWLTRPDVHRGLRAVATAGLTYDLLTLPHQLPAAIATARALPELTFVLDHLSKPPIARGELQPWASLIRQLAAQPNVFCKLSGMVTEAQWDHWSAATLRPYADVVLDAFGPERVMFGSDWPVCLLAASYEEVVAAAEELTGGLTEAERCEIFGGTATRAYRLRREDL